MEMTTDAEHLIARARTARTHNAASSGACVRDMDGQTYVATNIGLPSLRISSLQLAVAMAVSAGADAIQDAAVVSDSSGPSEIDVVRDLAGAGVPVVFADIAGRLQQVCHT